MNFNLKNLSENPKRIRIIPKNGAVLSANVGVDNPTAMIDEDGVFSVCLSPSTPTIPFCQIGPKYNCYFIINLLEGETGNINELLDRIVNEATVSISGQKLVKTDNQGSRGYYSIEIIDDSYVRIVVEGYDDVELRDYDVEICTPVQVTIEPEYQ